MRRQNRRKTFHNQKHRITVSLFLVCLCFIIIIIPQTAIQLINYFTENLSMSLVLNIYSITELIYLMNFVINPIIFAYNNSYLTEQIKKRIPKRFKKNPQKGGKEKSPNGVTSTPFVSLDVKKTNVQTMPTTATPAETDVWKKSANYSNGFQMMVDKLQMVLSLGKYTVQKVILIVKMSWKVENLWKNAMIFSTRVKCCEKLQTSEWQILINISEIKFGYIYLFR